MDVTIPVPPGVWALTLPVTLVLVAVISRRRLGDLWDGLVGLINFGQDLRALSSTMERVSCNETAIRRIGRQLDQLTDQVEEQADELEPLHGMGDKLDGIDRFLRTRDAAYGIQFEAMDKRLDRIEQAIAENGNGGH